MVFEKITNFQGINFLNRPVLSYLDLEKHTNPQNLERASMPQSWLSPDSTTHFDCVGLRIVVWYMGVASFPDRICPV